MAQKRLVEIDALRTIAIMLMVVFHAAYDLRMFYGWNIDLFGDAWQTLRILTASLFLIVSGVATNLSSHPLKRACIVIGCALLVSGATFLYQPSNFIYFGILHCIGLGMLMLIVLKPAKEFNIALGIAVMMLPYIPAPMATLDYYPPTPWLGLMLIGAGLGHYLYVRKKIQLPLPQTVLTLPGRHSLLIYLVHQPIIMGVLWLTL